LGLISLWGGLGIFLLFFPPKFGFGLKNLILETFSPALWLNLGLWISHFWAFKLPSSGKGFNRPKKIIFPLGLMGFPSF